MKNSILKGQLLLTFLYNAGLALLNSHNFLTDFLFNHRYLLLFLVCSLTVSDDLHSSSLRAMMRRLHWMLSWQIDFITLIFGSFFFTFLYVLVAMLQCHNARAVGEHHLRFSFQILIVVFRSSVNLKLINICQLVIIKSLKAESLLLKLIPKLT